MSSKLKFFILIGLFIFISLQYGSTARSVVASLSTTVIEGYLAFTKSVKNVADEHLAQQGTIHDLRAENKKLEHSALLSIAFASKLNHLLESRGIEPYEPELELVQALSYVNLGNHYRVWLSFKDFDPTKIYGLVYQGYTAGIVVNENGKPLGLLQGDPKSIFSVTVGDGDIPGVAMGNADKVHVKYIPQWMDPQVGDEVITSGMDTIFFAGIPVGKVIDVIQEESYQSVIVEPYVSTNVPMYMYAVE